MKKSIIFLFLILYAGAGAAADTLLKLYRPFGDGSGQTDLVIVKKIQGECTGQSKLILREDAWRCFAAGQLFDPCFAPLGAKPTKVVCPYSPWSNERVQIDLSTPLDNEAHQSLDMSRTFPWAIELVDGQRCQAVEPNKMYDSMPIRYHCTNQNLLMGTIQRCDPVWSVLEKTPEGVVTMNLSKAWF